MRAHPRTARPVPAARAAAAATAAAAVALAGCTGGDATDLTGLSAEELLALTADEMAEVTTVRLRVETQTDLAELPLRRAEAQVTRDGDAAGTAQVDLLGQLVEVEFVVVGDEFHYRLLGTWQQATRAEAASLYDPSTILDPDRGVPALLRTATDAELVATPDTSPEGRYEVSATFDPAAAGSLLPMTVDSLTGTLWIGPERPVLWQVRLDLPGTEPVTVELADFDAAADIRAP